MKELLLFGAVLFSLDIVAQSLDRTWGLGFKLGVEQYAGEFGNRFEPFSQ